MAQSRGMGGLLVMVTIPCEFGYVAALWTERHATCRIWRCLFDAMLVMVSNCYLRSRLRGHATSLRPTSRSNTRNGERSGFFIALTGK
jgi:hypothetical protein